MTQRERYGLTFLKGSTPYHGTFNRCICPSIGIHSRLQIINFLSIPECQDLIKEIENAENQRYFEEIFSADASGNDSIEIIPPNIVINDDCIIPLSDMKQLLQEWINFCSL